MARNATLSLYVFLYTMHLLFRIFFDKIAYTKYLPKIKTNHSVYIHTYVYYVTSTFSIALTLFRQKRTNYWYCILLQITSCFLVYNTIKVKLLSFLRTKQYANSVYFLIFVLLLHARYPSALIIVALSDLLWNQITAVDAESPGLNCFVLLN